MTPEGIVKKQIVAELKHLKEAGYRIWWYCPVQNGMGHKGIPDFVGCISSKFFSIEAKSEVGKATTLQQIVGDEIKGAGGTWLIVNPDNIRNLTFHLLALTK